MTPDLRKVQFPQIWHVPKLQECEVAGNEIPAGQVPDNARFVQGLDQDPDRAENEALTGCILSPDRVLLRPMQGSERAPCRTQVQIKAGLDLVPDGAQAQSRLRSRQDPDCAPDRAQVETHAGHGFIPRQGPTQ